MKSSVEQIVESLQTTFGDRARISVGEESRIFVQAREPGLESELSEWFESEITGEWRISRCETESGDLYLVDIRSVE